MGELIQVASELALSDHSYTSKYDREFGKSGYRKSQTQSDDLYNTSILAKHGDFSLIPQPVGPLSKDKAVQL